MGPGLILYARGQPMDPSAMSEAMEAAAARNFDDAVAAIAAQADAYAVLLGAMSDEDFRSEAKEIDGSSTTCGEFIVSHVVGQYAAYRMQLFLYLKACGRQELNTMNLWLGIDAPAAA